MNMVNSNDDGFIARLTKIVEANLDDEQFGVNELAVKTGLSRSQIHRRLKKSANKSLSQFIREIRLEKAKEMLEDEILTSSEIAYKVGFGSPSYFIKSFHDYFGYPPGEYLKYAQGDSGKKENTALKNKDIHIKKERKSFLRISVTNNKVLFVLLAIAILISGIFIVVKKYRNRDLSIAILPLHNLTGETDNDFFVDGMHDALIGELGKIGLLRVISRTSTLHYRESNKLLKEIAEELGVKTIVEGSVVGAGDSLRILIQLIDVFPKERHLLSVEYQDGMNNVLNLQSSVVKDIAKTINVKLSTKEYQQLNRSRTVNPETYKLYLQGMYSLNQGTEESFEKGMNYLNDAIKRDPGDPFAYAGVALGYATKGHGQLKSEEAFLLAMSSAEKAIKLDPTLNEALTALSLFYLYNSWDWTKAKETFESVLLNNPNNAIANAHFAWYHVLYGDFEKSIYYGKKAVMLEPLSASYTAWLALLYFNNKEYDLAENYARKALSLKENIPYGNFALGNVCIIKGQYQQAIKYHEKLPKEGAYYKMMRGYAYLKAGQREKALELWNELEDQARNKRVNSCYRGMMAAYLGFTDKAFELLNEAIDRKDYPIIYINTYIFTEDIRTDPRFNKLLLRMNLPTQKILVTDHQLNDNR